MRILIIHNFYREPGGEDGVYRAESDLLRSHGHQVFQLERHNRDTLNMGRVALASTTLWSRQSYQLIQETVRREQIDVVHFHNTLPLISPSGYWAARSAGAAVVQTLHNFRLTCVNALLFRDGALCERCLGRSIPLSGVRFGCYRESRIASAAVATMLAIHRGLGTWRSRVDRYIALTEFSKRKLIAGGLPQARIAVKPNFVADRGTSSTQQTREGFLFVGRFSPEKGIDTLIAASRDINSPITLAGDGPVRLDGLPAHVSPLGRVPPEQVSVLMGRACALVFPSIWYEGFPMVIVEANAAGLPVIASRIGGIAEIVEDGVTGLLVTPGDAADLAAKMHWAQTHPEAMAEMGQAARRRYETHYTAEKNYAMLMDVYRDAIAQKNRY